ncbi:uncharacterized protein NECHADRAFT_80852 [Fusarium vanettenii 77-13-4]|uniref:Transcription factor domain-containing protein n=1 Tax=Fusarium vanettenii (strain ATCC MYA-4622 / CBS 123669 / FGSC 9596 / NRRL 45880 / 77-13-4) TaxID=660122 RepID=C7YSU2_FUSV7|nr:uncharacterized protein NECHADRAFT_80852 [Fusarium vanettenii 77-13-4]EEU45707.1 hypothetical protein NECHADRAFT_80852 [Fusarium vanettenii 77-13-4]
MGHQRRRRKCDGSRPNYRECHIRRDRCFWGLKVSFHPSRSLQLSSEHVAALGAVDRQRQEAQVSAAKAAEPSSPTLIIIDDTGDIVQSYTRDDAQSPENGSDCQVEQDTGSEHIRGASDLTPRASQPYLGYFNNGRGGIYVEESGHNGLNDDNAAPGEPIHPFDVTQPLELPPSDVFRPPLISDSSFPGSSISPFSLGQAFSRRAPPEPEPRFPVSQQIKADLISNYIRETATWCETTDSDMHFSARSVHRMMESTPFVAAAMSLASRQLDSLRGRPRQTTLELYQYTVRLLLSHDHAVDGSFILATCTLLCVYEMMASTVAEWRRHLQGCAGLLRMRKWNDVWAAFILNQTTLIPTDSWVEADSLAEVAARGNTDDYCNFSILVFARIINLLNAGGDSSSAEWRDKAQASWEELQQWRRWHQQSAKPLMRVDAGNKNPFPTIVFALSASICGNTFYHTGSILLLQSGLVPATSSVDEKRAVSYELDPVEWEWRVGGLTISSAILYGMPVNLEASLSAIHHTKPLILTTIRVAMCTLPPPRLWVNQQTRVMECQRLVIFPQKRWRF